MRTFATSSLVAAAAAVAGLAGSAQAQLDPSLVNGLSSNCASGLVGIVTNSNVSSCLALPNAVGALTSAGNSSSVIPGLQQYLGGSICGSSKTACTQSQLSSANSTLLQACSSDLQNNNGQNIPALVYYFINNYDRLRDAACLENSSGQYCLIQGLYTVQNSTGMNLTFSEIQNLLSSQSTQQQTLQALAQNKTAFCTDCNHALYSELFPNNSNQEVSGAVSQTCGSNFTNGQIPSGIRATANGNSTSSSSSSSSSGSSSSSSKNAAKATLNTGALAAAGASALAAVAAGLTLL